MYKIYSYPNTFILSFQYMQAIWDIGRWLLTWDNYIFDSTPQKTKQSYLREHYLPLYREGSPKSALNNVFLAFFLTNMS